MKSRIIIWPAGGGDVVDQFDADIESGVEPDQLLAYFENIFGAEPTDFAYGVYPELGRVSIGWVFPVPDSFSVPGPKTDYEVVAMPMTNDPESKGEIMPLFLLQARQNKAVDDLHASGEIQKVVRVELPQRPLGGAPGS